jgi:hypothetical protein
MPMLFYLLEAYQEIIKKNGTAKSIYDIDGYQARLMREIFSVVTDWPFGAQELVDARNWNIENLKDERYLGGLRRPGAYFDIFITSKGNLALDWYPTKDRLINPDMRMTDWVRWDYQWPIGGGNYNLPFNRVFMIRDFEIFNYWVNHEKSIERIDEYLAKAVESLIDHIYSYLRDFVDVIELTRLYLKHKEEKQAQRRGREIAFAGFEIGNVEEVEKERTAKKKKKWIDDICREFLTTPEEFLKEFKANEMMYALTAKKFSNKSKKLSLARTKKLVLELYDFPEIYDSVLDQPPPGIQTTDQKGQIIPVSFSKKKD